jgi:hypothetical protein
MRAAFSARRCSSPSGPPPFGKPFQMISFFSFWMMFMAMSTLMASYTRRRMFFSSYGTS